MASSARSAERARADAVDDEAEARAWGDTSEIAFENWIRGLDSALMELDRDQPGRGARGAVFPRGFGEVIEPDGEAQLAVLPALLVRTRGPCLPGGLTDRPRGEHRSKYKHGLRPEGSEPDHRAPRIDRHRRKSRCLNSQSEHHPRALPEVATGDEAFRYPVSGIFGSGGGHCSKAHIADHCTFRLPNHVQVRPYQDRPGGPPGLG